MSRPRRARCCRRRFRSGCGWAGRTLSSPPAASAARTARGFYDYDGRQARPARARGLRRAAGVAAATARRWPAEVIESRLVLPMINEAAYLPGGRHRPRAGEARPRDDLRHGLSAVPRRASPLRGRARRRPRLHAARRSLRAPRARASRRPRSLRALANARKGFYGDRRSTPEVDAMTERLTGGVAVAADPRLVAGRQVALRGPDPGGHGLPVSRRSIAEEKETVSAFLDSLRGFARDHIDAARIEREHRIPPEVVKGLAELGAFGMTIPEEYGGYGFSSSAYCRVTEEIGTIDASLGILIGGHQSIGMKGLLLYGNRRAEAPVAAAARLGRDDRGVRPDRAGGGLRRRLDPDDRGVTTRRTTSSSSTAPSTGSPTAASPSSSRSSRRTSGSPRATSTGASRRSP